MSEMLPNLPKLIVEVIGPCDRMSTMEKRVAQFQRSGVPMVWVIDPEDRPVMVFRPGELTQVLTDEDELTGNGILPDFRCRVADFFYASGEAEDARPSAPS
jgi:Uma2 family endonuclease